jgi:membrane protease YdiL (CAAX protease family)
MKKYSCVVIALVILATSAPTLVIAQYENQGGGQPDTTILTIFSLILYITIFAILGVVGHSIWKVLKIRRKTAKIRMVQ